MKTLAVFSAKGGVGKSTVSCYTARALQSLGHPTGLLDGDFYSPNDLVILKAENLKLSRTKGDMLSVPNLDGLKILSWAMIWPPGRAVMIEDRQVEPDDLYQVIALITNGYIKAAVKQLTQLAEDPGGAVPYMRALFKPGMVDWGDIEYLVVDTPPTTGGVVRAVAEVGLWGALLVTHPSSPSIEDVKRTIDLFRRKKIPIVGLISNQGKSDGVDRYDLTDKHVEEFCSRQDIPFIGAVPHVSPDKLIGYFEKVAGFVLDASPVLLPEIVTKEDLSAVRKAKKLLGLLEVFSK